MYRPDGLQAQDRPLRPDARAGGGGETRRGGELQTGKTKLLKGFLRYRNVFFTLKCLRSRYLFRVSGLCLQHYFLILFKMFNFYFDSHKTERSSCHNI